MVVSREFKYLVCSVAVSLLYSYFPAGTQTGIDFYFFFNFKVTHSVWFLRKLQKIGMKWIRYLFIYSFFCALEAIERRYSATKEFDNETCGLKIFFLFLVSPLFGFF